MSLSCYCDNDGEWWHFAPDDFSTLDTKRSRKCCSCGERIAVGDVCGKFDRGRVPNSIVEERIYGTEEVPQSPWFMCERCTGLYFSLSDLGFCLNLGEDMRALVREYAAMKEPTK